MGAIISSILGSSVLTALITNAFAAWKETKRSNKIDRMLLFDALERQAALIIARGEIGAIELKRIEQYYQLYKALGGDGYADQIIKSIRNLPIKFDV